MVRISDILLRHNDVLLHKSALFLFTNTGRVNLYHCVHKLPACVTQFINSRYVYRAGKQLRFFNSMLNFIPALSNLS